MHWWLVVVPPVVAILRREVRIYRRITNGSLPVNKPTKKSPAPDRDQANIEYGGHHLP